MRDALVFALHGFLGDGEDFLQLKKILASVNIEVVAPSLFAPVSNSNDESLSKVLACCLSDLRRNQNSKKVYLGYSLGARMGLTLLAQEPQLFDYWIFVSANPGFEDADTFVRKQRVESDMAWSDQISSNNWKNFIEKWNAQPVFGETQVKNINIEKYSLALLKKAFSEQSLGLQPNYRPVLKKNSNNIYWVVGERDLKFAGIGEELKQSGIVQNFIKLSAGHRVHLDNPKDLADLILKILN